MVWSKIYNYFKDMEKENTSEEVRLNIIGAAKIMLTYNKA